MRGSPWKREISKRDTLCRILFIKGLAECGMGVKIYFERVILGEYSSVVPSLQRNQDGTGGTHRTEEQLQLGITLDQIKVRCQWMELHRF